MSDLIDTTEMYLRTIFELIEEGVVPLRARIAERLGQSGPTVSQTVARMERDGLLVVTADRSIALTQEGSAIAARVMRKHRLAERLLVDVIGLDLALVHDEACRWEHVISEGVERRLVTILGNPTVSPYGNPIPALEELHAGGGPAGEAVSLASALGDADTAEVQLAHLSEQVQADAALLGRLTAAGIVPERTFSARRTADGVEVWVDAEPCTLDADTAALVFVRP